MQGRQWLLDMAATSSVSDDRPEPPAKQTAVPSGLSSGAFVAVLSAICLLALAFNLAILREGLRGNPFVMTPTLDGEAYWRMAGRIADGQLTEDTPFLAAPLYPYLLGAVRALGGGLTTVYVLQTLMHIATAGLLGWATRARFGTGAGLLAAVFFLALTEAAYATNRVLGSTLQLFLVTLLWWRWHVLASSGFSWVNALLVGGLIGLLALAFPPAMLLAPLYGLWLWWKWSDGLRGLGRGLAGAATTLAVISPATAHNLLIHGEFIPITAHGGFTLAQGNTPTGMGIVNVVPGIGLDRATMHEEAAQLYERIHGRRGTWREVDAFLRDKAFEFWRQNPRGAFKLAALKLYLYFTCRSYDDGMMCVTMEKEAGLANLAFLAPLPVPWLLGAALVGAVLCMRSPARNLPEWVLFFLPLLVVLIFFYGPRYRLMAAPLACALAACALMRFPRWRRGRAAAIAVFLLPIGLRLLVVPAVDTPAWLGERFWPAYLQQMGSGPDSRHPPTYD